MESSCNRDLNPVINIYTIPLPFEVTTMDRFNGNDPNANKYLIKSIFMIFIYIIGGLITSFGTLQFAANANQFAILYHVSPTASMCLTAAVYACGLVAPFMTWRLVTYFGSRKSLLFACYFNCLGVFLKLESSEQDRFGVAIVSQIIISFAHFIIFTHLPYSLINSWFTSSPSNGNLVAVIIVIVEQLGYFSAFLTSFYIFPDDFNSTRVMSRLYYWEIIPNTVIAIIYLVLVFLAFQSAPKESKLQFEMNTSNIWKDFTQNLKDQTVLWQILPMSLQIGVYYAFLPLSSQIVKSLHFPNKQSESITGLITVGCSVIGTIVSFPVSLKKVPHVVPLLCTFGVAAMAIALNFATIYACLYSSAAIIGFFFGVLNTQLLKLKQRQSYLDSWSIHVSCIAVCQGYACLVSLVGSFLLTKYSIWATSLWIVSTSIVTLIPIIIGKIRISTGEIAISVP